MTGRAVLATIAAVALAATGATSSVAQPGSDRAAPTHVVRPTESTTPATAGASVVVRDITIRVRHQDPIQAYLVRPSGGLPQHSSAGILWLHWLGQIHNDRTEYLSEAIAMADQGVVSVLPQGYFPWVPNPDGTSNDIKLIKDQVNAMGAALDRLAAVRAVDKHRIAIVGHDYGAMYGALLADRDHRVSTLVLETPDSLWGNWFATFWLQLEGAERDAYLAQFAGLDPVDHTARLGSDVLFQWAGDDFFIPAEVHDAFAATSPDAKVLVYDNADHQLTDAAQVDRDAFLAEHLDLP